MSEYPRVLDAVYGTHYEATSSSLRYLGDMYELPACHYSLETTNRSYFEYAELTKHFVVLVAYTDKKEVLLFVGADGARENYYLPARKLGPEQSIEQVCRTLSRELLPRGEFTGFEPIARLHHSFRFRMGNHMEEWCQEGIAYIVRLMPGSVEPYQNPSLRNAALVKFPDVRRVLSEGNVTKYSNREVLEHALNRLESFFQLRVRQPDEEIQANRASLARYRLHEALVKPMLRLIKKTVRFDAAILNMIGKPARFLDASCGDSKIVLAIARRGAELAVGNDISWSQISLLLERLGPRERPRTLFTNHNLVALPFREKFFDVALCKNTLHHLNAPMEFKLAMQGLTRVARKVVIVEVENPEVHFVSKLINTYYRKYLRDVGEHFFSAEQFREAIDRLVKTLGDCSVRYSRFRSLHANYLFAEIDTIKEAPEASVA